MYVTRRYAMFPYREVSCGTKGQQQQLLKFLKTVTHNFSCNWHVELIYHMSKQNASLYIPFCESTSNRDMCACHVVGVCFECVY